MLESSKQDVPQTNRKPLRFVDLCAGLGGFHVGVMEAVHNIGDGHYDGIECVLAAELDVELRRLYVDNFRVSLGADYQKYHPPEYVAKLDTEQFGDIYDAGELKAIHGAIETFVGEESLKLWPDQCGDLSGKPLIPKHDLLCAGFPCQPFSKSGTQLGFSDTRGTIFGLILKILKDERVRPRYVLLENVGNFPRHDGGNTWDTVYNELKACGYLVGATTQVQDKERGIGDGLLSPHHHGYPHHRERFFIAAVDVSHAKELGLRDSWYPFERNHRQFSSRKKQKEHQEKKRRESAENLDRILRQTYESGDYEAELEHAKVDGRFQPECIRQWQELLDAFKQGLISSGKKPLFDAERDLQGNILKSDNHVSLPSFPIWGYELDPWRQYPLKTDPNHDEVMRVAADIKKGLKADLDPLRKYWLSRQVDLKSLERQLPPPGSNNEVNGSVLPWEWGDEQLHRWISSWPSYVFRLPWPKWKTNFVKCNRKWAKTLYDCIDGEKHRYWLDGLSSLPPSFQKFEWNCKGEAWVLCKCILQFRPSGLRVKRYREVPALVAMTMTQVPMVPRPESEPDFGSPVAVRFLLKCEAAALLGLPDKHKLPQSHSAAYKALGNGVHAHVVRDTVRLMLSAKGSDM